MSCNNSELNNTLLALLAAIQGLVDSERTIDLTNTELTIDNAGVITELQTQTTALSAKFDEVVTALDALHATETLGLTTDQGTGISQTFGGAGVESITVINQDAVLDALVNGGILEAGESLTFARSHKDQTMPTINVQSDGGGGGANIRVDVLAVV